MIVKHTEKIINAINNIVFTKKNVTHEGSADNIITPDTTHGSIVTPDTVVAQQTTLLHTSDPPDILDKKGDDIVKAYG